MKLNSPKKASEKKVEEERNRAGERTISTGSFQQQDDTLSPTESSTNVEDFRISTPDQREGRLASDDGGTYPRRKENGLESANEAEEAILMKGGVPVQTPLSMPSVSPDLQLAKAHMLQETQTTSVEKTAHTHALDEPISVEMVEKERDLAAHMRPSSSEATDSTDAGCRDSTPPVLVRHMQRMATPGAFSVQGISMSAVTDSSEPSEDSWDESEPSHVPTGDNNRNQHVIQAVEVHNHTAERAQLEAEIRSTIMREAVQANVMPSGSDDQDKDPEKDRTGPATNKRKLLAIFGAGGFVLVAIALALGVGLGLSKREDNGPENLVKNSVPTLELVRERGYIRCGVNDLGFDSKVDPEVSDHLEGFTVEQCRAMALLALGDSSKYEQVWVTPFTRFSLLANKSIDIATEGTTYTMERDIYEGKSSTAFSFTPPYFYSGLAFGGIPEMVDCAEAGEDFYEHCRSLKICVAAGTTHIDILKSTLQGGAIVPYNGTETLIESLHSGKCNVVASEPLFLVKVQDLYGGADWKLGAKAFSKEPLSLVTRQDDPQWSALADLAVNAFFFAEANNISKENAYEINELTTTSNTEENGSSLAFMLVSLISEFGHHGDLYDKHIQDQIPRQNGLNTIYDSSASSGLLYSIPMGNIQGTGPGPMPNGTLDRILKRGHLICGVQRKRGTEFVEGIQSTNATNTSLWSGFDSEMCRGLAASLFIDKNKVVFVELFDETSTFTILADNTVDVIAGARVTLEASHKAPTTGKGYAFSTPYFYENNSRNAYAFMTQQEDPQWSDFVNWIIMAIIYAEEEGITADTSAKMPVVELFGDHLKQMFRDCVSAVGNFAELYNRTLQATIPRSGANRLNEGLAGPQLFPIPLS